MGLFFGRQDKSGFVRKFLWGRQLGRPCRHCQRGSCPTRDRL